MKRCCDNHKDSGNRHCRCFHSPCVKKLVLFDIDGTLIYHVGRKTSWTVHFSKPLAHVYGIPITMRNPDRHDGSIERKIAWDILEENGKIDKDVFMAKFPLYLDLRRRVYENDAKTEQLYRAIPDAVSLINRLHMSDSRFILGLLTGNARSIAQWKLSHAGVQMVFTFGLYGDEADDRITLARLVFARAKEELGFIPEPGNIIVIGDTIHDVRCGQAIGAFTIAVKTGGHTREQLQNESPDLLVDSLQDKRVLALFSLA